MRILSRSLRHTRVDLPVEEDGPDASLRSNRGLLFSSDPPAHFAGLIHFPQYNEGYQKPGAVTFRDEIMMRRAPSEEDGRVRRFWIALKEDLKRRWRQKEILIGARDIVTP